MTNDPSTPTIGDTARSLKGDAAQLKDKAADRLAGEADARKGQVADGMKQVSSALDAARSDLEGSDTPDWLRSGLRSVASSVERLAGELESKDAGQLADGVRDFARDRPAVFLGACAAAGFAAARVFTAGGSPSRDARWSAGSSAGFGDAGDRTSGGAR